MLKLQLHSVFRYKDAPPLQVYNQKEELENNFF